jgi:ankyrin repeat protein
MLNRIAFFMIMMTVTAHQGLWGQDVPNVPEGIGKSTASTPFPSSADLRSKINIRLVRHGCYGSCAQYSVSVLGNGKILYDGGEYVRVKGQVRANIAHKAVDDLIRKINDFGFFDFQPHKSQRCVTDGPTATITVSEPGREKQIDDECVESQELEELEEAIDNAVEIQQWVFINATELQRQIDRGWDLTIHGQEYAQQAIEWDDPHVIQVLVKNGLPIETQNDDRETLLMQAVLRNRYRSARALLELGANPQTRDSYGGGPSQNAGNRSVEMCKLFLAHGAGINDQDGMGETMLTNAAGSQDDLKIVRFLVSSGAAVNLRNHNGETAMGVAKRMRQQFQQFVELTFRADYPAILGDSEKNRAGNLARVQQYEAVIEFLRQHGGTE